MALLDPDERPEFLPYYPFPPPAPVLAVIVARKQSHIWQPKLLLDGRGLAVSHCGPKLRASLVGAILASEGHAARLRALS